MPFPCFMLTEKMPPTDMATDMVTGLMSDMVTGMVSELVAAT